MEQDKRDEEHVSSQTTREREVAKIAQDRKLDQMAQDVIATMVSPESVAKHKKEDEEKAAKDEQHMQELKKRDEENQRKQKEAKEKQREDEEKQRKADEKRRLQREAYQREQAQLNANREKQFEEEKQRQAQAEKDKKNPPAGAAMRRRDAEKWDDDTYAIELMRSNHPDDFDAQVDFIDNHYDSRWQQLQTNRNSLLHQQNISGDSQYLRAIMNWHDGPSKPAYTQTIRKVILRNLENQGKRSKAQPLLRDGNVPPMPSGEAFSSKSAAPQKPAPVKKSFWGFFGSSSQTNVEPPPEQNSLQQIEKIHQK
jgi:hypothetical protein